MKNKFWSALKKKRKLSQTDREHLKRSGYYILPVRQKQATSWSRATLQSLLNWPESSTSLGTADLCTVTFYLA
jgi:hypothetical protein